MGSDARHVASVYFVYPITSMRIYVDNVSKYSVSASSLDTYIGMRKGSRYVVIQAWDTTGAVFETVLSVNVQ